MNILEYLFGLLLGNWYMLVIRILLSFTLFGLVFFVSKWTFMRFAKVKKNVPLESHFATLKSSILVLATISLYVYFVIRYNGQILFDWTSFAISLSNTYIMTLHVLLKLVMLIYIFFSTMKKIKSTI